MTRRCPIVYGVRFIRFVLIRKTQIIKCQPRSRVEMIKEDNRITALFSEIEPFKDVWTVMSLLAYTKIQYFSNRMSYFSRFQVKLSR
jgi:predicted regulator of amino acid metabolism with ACT domain